MNDFKIIVITSPECVSDEAYRLTKLLDAGLDALHIRKPMWKEEDIQRLVEGIPVEYRCRLAIHGNPKLAERLGCRVHGVNSRSCHSVDELSETECDYVFLSPVFDSISKSGYLSRFELSNLDLSTSKSPVVALGGVMLSKVPEVRNAGFCGAAFLGQVWNADGGYQDMLRYLRLRNVGFQFITNAPDVAGTVTQAEKAMQGGCRWIQVRMKDSHSADVIEAVERIASLRKKYGGATLIVDDHYRLLARDEVDGVHLGQLDMSPHEARKWGDPSKIIGLTVNAPEQLLGAEYGDVDYYGIGPFRFTTTKKRLAPVLGTDGYSRINSAMRLVGDARPYVAIGGIALDDVPSLLNAGVRGFAVSGSIASAPDPVEESERFKNIIYRYEKI